MKSITGCMKCVVQRTIDHSSISQYSTKFCEARDSTEDGPRSGQPKTMIDDMNAVLVTTVLDKGC